MHRCFHDKQLFYSQKLLPLTKEEKKWQKMTKKTYFTIALFSYTYHDHIHTLCMKFGKHFLQIKIELRSRNTKTWHNNSFIQKLKTFKRCYSLNIRYMRGSKEKREINMKMTPSSHKFYHIHKDTHTLNRLYFTQTFTHMIKSVTASAFYYFFLSYGW